jgi:hypothetical protein
LTRGCPYGVVSKIQIVPKHDKIFYHTLIGNWRNGGSAFFSVAPKTPQTNSISSKSQITCRNSFSLYHAPKKRIFCCRRCSDSRFFSATEELIFLGQEVYLLQDVSVCNFLLDIFSALLQKNQNFAEDIFCAMRIACARRNVFCVRRKSHIKDKYLPPTED